MRSPAYSFKSFQRVSLLGCAILLLIAGCGDGKPARYPVTGSVIYDGDSIKIGSLVFVPVDGGPSAQGRINPEGDYQMGTFSDTDGVIPGEYRVMITALTSPGGSGLPEDAVDGNAGPVSIIPEFYGDIGTSGLTATVEAKDENKIEFYLTDEQP